MFGEGPWLLPPPGGHGGIWLTPQCPGHLPVLSEVGRGVEGRQSEGQESFGQELGALVAFVEVMVVAG